MSGTPFQARSALMQALRESNCPALLATDGSHKPLSCDDMGHSFNCRTSSAVALCLPDIHSGEVWTDGRLQFRRSIPLFVRASRLPG